MFLTASANCRRAGVRAGAGAVTDAGANADAVTDAGHGRFVAYAILKTLNTHLDHVRAAGALCTWCHAIYIYANVAKEVAPKRARLKAAQDGLAQKQAGLAAAQASPTNRTLTPTLTLTLNDFLYPAAQGEPDSFEALQRRLQAAVHAAATRAEADGVRYEMRSEVAESHAAWVSRPFRPAAGSAAASRPEPRTRWISPQPPSRPFARWWRWRSQRRHYTL